MSLPRDVRDVIDVYLSRASGIINGLYLYGSVAQDDFCPPHSDIDFVALVDEDSPDIEALDALHQSLPGPAFDGIYLTARQLAVGPEAIGPTLFARDHRLHQPGKFEHNPITWHSLASQGVHCAGRPLSELDIWRDRDALLDYTRTNVDEYWRGLLVRGAAVETEPSPGGIMWVVLGIPRLHYTLATGGDLTSKTGAGEHALATFGAEWHPLVEACLTQRLGGEAPSPTLWPLALAFLAMAIDETLSL